MKTLLLQTVTISAIGLIAAPPAFATSFDITGSSTTAQTLGPLPNEVGTIELGGSLTVSGSKVAVTISGADAALTNLGTLSQTGTGRAIRDNTGVTGLVVTNGSLTNSTAIMQTADADVIQMNKSPASVTLNNYGVMTSLNASGGGSQVVDFNAILSGSNIVNNYKTGVHEGAPMPTRCVRASTASSTTGARSSLDYHADRQQRRRRRAEQQRRAVNNNTNTTAPSRPAASSKARGHGITGGARRPVRLFWD